MNKLLILTSVALVGGSVFAESIPRVYDYKATLKTTVAKNAATVTWTDANKVKWTEEDVCYRASGTVSVKGVIVLGCFCNSLNDVNEPVTMFPGYPLVMLATSADSYCQVVFAREDDPTDLTIEDPVFTDFWGVNRFGNAMPCKATQAGLGLDVAFTVGPTNRPWCQRYFQLSNAGMGTATKLEADEGYDVNSISGSTVGTASYPTCAASGSDCPRCIGGKDCRPALAFQPCDGEDCTVGPYDAAAGLGYDVAYGTFTLKFNKTYSNAIKDILPSEIQQTINALVPKAFNSCAKAPVYVPPAPEVTPAG